MRTAEGRAWLDGEWVPVDAVRLPLTAPAVQAGLGVFETLAVQAGQAQDGEPHLARLRHWAGRLGVALPDDAALVSAVIEVAAEVAGGHGWLKIVAVREGPCSVFAGALAPSEGEAATAVLLSRRANPADPLSGLKTLNYAASVLAQEEARRRGADEGLWLNVRGHLAEGATSNVFVVQRGKLFTPGERDGILPGITRGLALRAARQRGLTVHEGKTRLKRLLGADEAFLTSSVRGVRPLVALDGRPIGNGKAGPITRTIAGCVATLRRPLVPPVPAAERRTG